MKQTKILKQDMLYTFNQRDNIKKLTPLLIQTDILKDFFSKHQDDSYLNRIYTKLDELCKLGNPINKHDEAYIRDTVFITMILCKINEEKRGIYDFTQALIFAYHVSKLPLNEMINSIRSFFIGFSELIEEQASHSEACSAETSLMNKFFCLIKEKKWILPVFLLMLLYYLKFSSSNKISAIQLN